MNKAKEAQAKVKEAQANLVNLVISSESGGGMVKVTINGLRKVTRLEIDPSIMNDKEMVEDLTVAAINMALQNIEEEISAELKKSMQGVLPNIPGLDLESLIK